MALIGLKQLDSPLTGSLQVSGSSGVTGSINVSGDATVGGDVKVAQYIKHEGNETTLINFTSNRIRFKAGDIGFLDMEKDASAPYPFTINQGGNRVNFRVMDRNTELLLKTDSEAFNVKLYHAGNQKLQTISTGVEVTGSMILDEQTTTPTAVEGGLMYSGSNFYLGFD